MQRACAIAAAARPLKVEEVLALAHAQLADGSSAEWSTVSAAIGMSTESLVVVCARAVAACQSLSYALRRDVDRELPPTTRIDALRVLLKARRRAVCAAMALRLRGTCALSAFAATRDHGGRSVKDAADAAPSVNGSSVGGASGVGSTASSAGGSDTDNDGGALSNTSSPATTATALGDAFAAMVAASNTDMLAALSTTAASASANGAGARPKRSLDELQVGCVAACLVVVACDVCPPSGYWCCHAGLAAPVAKEATAEGQCVANYTRRWRSIKRR